MGVFRDVNRPTYDGLMSAQLATAVASQPVGDDALTGLLHGADTWTVL